jgi:streptogramin lyase
MFTDIVGSTDVASEMGDQRWRELLARHHALIRKELKRFAGREIDTAGDGFFAIFETPVDGIRCACAASESVHELGIDIRAGLHVGECEAMGKKVGGIAVHTGARVLSAAGAAEVLVTATARELVAGSGIDFEDRGSHALKGIPGERNLFVVTSLDGANRPPPLDRQAAAHLRESIVPQPRFASRRIPIAVTVAIVIVAGIGGFLLTRSRGDVVPQIDTVAEIPAGADGFSRQFDVGGAPNGVAAGEGSIWVINQSDGTVQRVNPDASDPIVATKSTLGPPTGIAVGEGSAWITTGFGTASENGSTGTLYRFDLATSDVMPAANSGGKAIAIGDGALWLADDVNDQVHRIDPKTGQVTTIQVGAQPVAIAIGPGPQSPVWVANAVDASVSRIDPATNRTEAFGVASAPSGIAVSPDGDVWVTSAVANTVSRLDATGHAIDTIRGISAAPTAIAASKDSVWVAAVAGRRVLRIDPSTDRVVEALAVSASPSSLTLDPDGDVWVTVRAE